MASAETPTAAVVDDSMRESQHMPDVPAHEPQATGSLPSKLDSTTFHDAVEEPAETTHNSSLSSPSQEADVAQQAATTAGSAQTSDKPSATSTNQIESSRGLQPITTQPPLPALNFAPIASGPAPNNPVSPTQGTMPVLTREKTAPAIGPATDKPTPVPKEYEFEGPVLFITLLLTSTGTRHPYKLDEKYLKKRNVIVEDNNPVNISLYKLKELILRDWRDEWEAKPSSPESIRLISMGKMLNDKSRLADSGFKNGTTPHIIHMTIKPQEIVDEEDARLKSGGRDREGNERSPGCRCLIM